MRTHLKLMFAVLPLVGILGSGCEVFEQLKDDATELATITIPVTFPVPVPLPLVYPSADQLAALPLNNDNEYVVEIPPVYVNADLAGLDPRLEQGASVVREIRLTGVTLSISDNTIDVPLQPIELRIGAVDTDFDQAMPAALSDELAAQFEGDHQAPLVADNSAEIAQTLAALRFGAGLGTTVLIPEGSLPAGGRATARFTLRLEIDINPIE
jgi:hypothetical protein